MSALAALDAKTDLAAVATGGAVNEDVMQKIWDISRIPLPGLDRIGRGTVTATKYDWVRDRLAAAAANAVVETAGYGTSAGAAEFVDSATAALNRFQNHVQISVKAVAVSEMANTVSSIGNSGSLAYNLMVAQRELMRDIEYSIFAVNAASVAGNGSSTAPKTASYASVLDVSGSNVVANDTFAQAGSGITQGGWETSGNTWAALTGTATAAALAESDIRGVVLNLFKNGACDTEKSLVAMTTAECKQVISAYMYTSTARIGSFVKETGDRAGLAVGNVEYFQTDYALLELVANRFMSTITLTNAFTPLWIFDPSQFELVYLRGPTTSVGAKQGLVDVRWVSAYWGTRFHPEACGGVVGIDATAAMTAT